MERRATIFSPGSSARGLSTSTVATSALRGKSRDLRSCAVAGSYGLFRLALGILDALLLQIIGFEGGRRPNRPIPPPPPRAAGRAVARDEWTPWAQVESTPANARGDVEAVAPSV